MAETILYSSKMNWLSGKFREGLNIPKSPDEFDGLEAGNMRVTMAYDGLEIYNGAQWLPIGGTGGTGSYKLYNQLIVGEGIDDGATTYQNDGLIGLFVDVFHQGSVLYTGLGDRISYTYNILTGTITFNSPVYTGEAIRIYTYSSSDSVNGITVVPTHAEMNLTGLPHFIQVQADENLQEDGEDTPISLYWWNGSEVVLIVSKVYVAPVPSTDIPLTFSERVAIIQTGTTFTGQVVEDGTGPYYHYGLCDYKIPDGVDGSAEYEVGANHESCFIGISDVNTNIRYNEYPAFAIIIGDNLYSVPDDPIASLVVGNKIRMRRTSDIFYIDRYDAGSWAEVYEIGSFTGDVFIGISMAQGADIINPIGQNLILK